MLPQHTDLTVLGDKRYVNDSVIENLRGYDHFRLIILRRKDETQHRPDAMTKLINQARQSIDQFNVQKKRERRFHSLCARPCSRVTAHISCVYINRLLDQSNLLEIKSLAFSNIQYKTLLLKLD